MTDNPHSHPHTEPENPRQRFLLDLADCGAGATQLRLALDGLVATGNLPARTTQELRILTLAAHDLVIALMKVQGSANEFLHTTEAASESATETARLH